MTFQISCVVCQDDLEGTSEKYSIFEKDPLMLTCLAFEIYKITGIQIIYKEDGGFLCQECYFQLVNICELEQEFKKKFTGKIVPKTELRKLTKGTNIIQRSVVQNIPKTSPVKRKVQQIWPGPNSGLIPIKPPKLLKRETLKNTEESTQKTVKEKQIPSSGQHDLSNAHASSTIDNPEKNYSAIIQHKEEHDPLKGMTNKLPVDKTQKGEDVNLAKIDLIPTNREEKSSENEEEAFDTNILSEYEDFEEEFEVEEMTCDVKPEPDMIMNSNQKSNQQEEQSKEDTAMLLVAIIIANKKELIFSHSLQLFQIQKDVRPG